MFFNDWLSRRRIYTPDRVAIVDDDRRQQHTYAELDDRASRAAGYLHGAYGIVAGDRVACLSTNRLEVVDLFFACGKLGATLVPLNYRLPPTGLTEMLEDCGPKLFVFEQQFAEFADAVFKSGIVGVHIPIEGIHDGSTKELPAELHQARNDEVAMILYTSGTTGRAKGAMISWRQIHWNALNTIIGLQLTQEDVAFLNMPLYHTGGWHVLFTPLMMLGGRVVLQKRFDAQRCNERIGAEGITILFGVPTMLQMMRAAPNFASADFCSVRFAICGGEPCPLSVIDAYQQRGVPIRQGYGLTEAGPNCFSLPAADAHRKEGSIGFPNFFIQTRLVKDDGANARPGEVGELWMTGPHVFAGYWGNAAEADAALADGWLRTGDLMTRDAEGYHFVVGRKKQMYISGGENVYPAQVERILQQHPAVAAAAVVGVADQRWGEVGWAFVQLHENCDTPTSDIDLWCKEHLAKFQCPKKIVPIDNLPIGSSGKIDKQLLRELAEQENGSS